jgi:hypothetical protein
VTSAGVAGKASIIQPKTLIGNPREKVSKRHLSLGFPGILPPKQNFLFSKSWEVIFMPKTPYDMRVTCPLKATILSFLKGWN